MKKLLTICAAVGLIMAVTGAAQAALDVNAIIMTSCKNYVDGAAGSTPWCFEVWVELDNPDTLHHIDVSPTGGAPFTIYDDFGYWEYDSLDYSTIGDLRAVYPVGNYTFDFLSDTNSSLLTFGLDYTGISEPCSPVNFTHPSTNGETGISTTPTFEWLVDSGDGDALYMWLDNDDCYENGPATITTSWGPLGPLDPSHIYNLEVSVFNAKGLEDGPAFPTMNPSGTDEFKYGLWIEHLNEIEFTTVPEPATIALLGLGSLLLSRGRKFNSSGQRPLPQQSKK